MGETKLNQFRFWFVLFMLLFGTIAGQQEESYNWTTFLHDIFNFLNNPFRIFAFIFVVLDYFEKEKK